MLSNILKFIQNIVVLNGLKQFLRTPFHLEAQNTINILIYNKYQKNSEGYNKFVRGIDTVTVNNSLNDYVVIKSRTSNTQADFVIDNNNQRVYCRRIVEDFLEVKLEGETE